MRRIHTPNRRGDVFQMAVKRAAVIPDGAIVVSDAGYAAPGRKAAGLVFLGRADSEADDSEDATGVPGGSGELTVRIRRGMWFRWRSVAGAGAVTETDVGKTAYIADERSVTTLASGASPAGLIVDLEDGGVWVEHNIGAPSLGGAPANLSTLDISVDGKTIVLSASGTQIDALSEADLTALFRKYLTDLGVIHV